MTERCPTCNRPFAPSRSDDPATSEAGGEHASAREGAVLDVRPDTQRARLLHAYFWAWREGWPDDAISDEQAADRAGLNRPGVCWWKRSSELRQGGFIEVAGTTAGNNGVEVQTCRISTAGVKKYEALFPRMSV